MKNESDYSSLDRFFCGKPTLAGSVITEAATAQPTTVGRLIELLKDVDPKTPVWMAKDSEGNHFSKLWDIDLSDRSRVTLWPD